MNDHLSFWIEVLCSIEICSKEGFNLVLAYVPFHREQGVEITRVDQNQFLIYSWCSGEVIGLAHKCVLECKDESSGQFVYHECGLPAIAG